MATWNVSFKIEGTGFATVEAETYDEAAKKAKDFDFLDEPEINEWDINDQGYLGGYIDVEDAPREIG